MKVDEQISKLIDDKIHEYNLAMREYIFNGVIMPFRKEIREINRRLGIVSRDLNRQISELSDQIENIKRKLGAEEKMSKDDNTEVKITQAMFNRHMKEMFIELLQPLQSDLSAIKRKLGMAGTELSCVGGCGGLARKGSNYCQACRDERILAVVGEKASDLPLNARVAKALGRKVYNDDNGLGWQMEWGDRKGSYTCPVSDYDKHVDLAMGAFWTYLILNYKQGQIEIDERGNGQIIIYSGDLINTLDKFAYHFCNPITAKDFCEAIAAHAEGK